MADDNTASVKIVADASGVQPGVDQAKAAIQQLPPELANISASMQEMAAAMREGFAQVSAQLAGTKEELRNVEEETERGAISFREMAASMKETAASVHEGVLGFNEFKAGIREAFEAYMAFMGVEMFGEMAEKMGEAAEQTQHLAQRFGITTAQVQGLKGASLATGVSFDTMTRGMTMLDKIAETTPEKFAKLGIQVQANEGHMRLLMATADRFKDLAKGPDAVAASYELMGRMGVQLLPVLSQGSEGLQRLMDKAREYGEVNDAAVASGAALAESVNEGKMAWDGLKQTMTQAFAPLLTEMVDGFNGLVKAMTASYQSGGTVKTIFEGIVAVIEGFGEIFNSVADGVSEMFKEMGFTAGQWGTGIQTAVNVVVAAVKLLLAGVVGAVVEVGAAFDDIRGYLTTFDATLREKFATAGLRIEELKITFQTLGTVMEDVLTFHWGSIAADWQAGMAHLADVARDGAAKIKAAAAGEQKEAAGYHQQGANAQAGYQKWVKGFFAGPHAAPKKTGVEGGDGGGGDTPDLSKHKKGKSDQASIVQQDQAELQDELLKEENWGADSTALTAKFWAEKLAATTKGTKEWAQIHKLAATAQLAEFKKEQQDEVSTIRETASVKTALAKDDADIAKIGLQEKLAAIDEEEKAGTISAVRASQLKALVNQEMLQEERSYQTTIFGIQMAAMQEELDLKHLPAEEQKKIHRQMESAQAEFNARMKVMDAQASQQSLKDQTATADAIRSKWQGILQPIAQAWGQSLEKMITSAGSLRDMLANVGQAILQQAIGWIEKIGVRFITGEQTKTAAAAAGAAEREGIEASSATTSIMTSAIAAIKQIAHSAAVAAARAYAAIAQIPIVGPILAPAAAAAALAGVIALGKTVFSAEGGMDNVPADGTMIYAHKNEMVLSAQYADVIRGLAGFAAGGGFAMPAMPAMQSMSLPASLATPIGARLGGGAGAAAATGGQSAGGSGGDFHYHDHSGRLSPDDIMANRGVVAAAMKKAHREGHFAGTRITFG